MVAEWLLKFAAAIVLWQNKAMNTLKPKANAARKVAQPSGRGELSSVQPKVVNPYALSAQAAAKAVRRAGIVTATGKLTRIYK